MLRKVGKYNDVTLDLIPKLPEKGTVVQYQFIHVYHNPIKTISGHIPGRKDGIHYQYCKKMPTVSNFWDSVKNQFVPIGMVDTVDINGSITRQSSLYFYPLENHGFYTLTIGESAEVDRIWTYLEMASFVQREDDQFIRDESEELIMKKVDNVKEAQRLRDKRALRKKAIDIAYAMTDDEIIRTALIIPFDVNQPIDTLRNLVEDYSETHPELFIRQASDPDADVKATLAQGIETGILTVDKEANSLRYARTNGTIMIFNSLENIHNQFADWVRDPSNKTAEGHLKNIKQEIAASASGRKRGRPVLEK